MQRVGIALSEARLSPTDWTKVQFHRKRALSTIRRETRPLKALIQAVIADRAMLEPSRNLTESMTKAGRPAYFYRFSYVAESQHPEMPDASMVRK